MLLQQTWKNMMHSPAKLRKLRKCIFWGHLCHCLQFNYNSQKGIAFLTVLVYNDKWQPLTCGDEIRMLDYFNALKGRCFRWRKFFFIPFRLRRSGQWWRWLCICWTRCIWTAVWCCRRPSGEFKKPFRKNRFPCVCIFSLAFCGVLCYNRNIPEGGSIFRRLRKYLMMWGNDLW